MTTNSNDLNSSFNFKWKWTTWDQGQGRTSSSWLVLWLWIVDRIFIIIIWSWKKAEQREYVIQLCQYTLSFSSYIYILFNLSHSHGQFKSSSTIHQEGCSSPLLIERSLSAGTKAPPTFASLALLPATRRGEGEREETKDPHLMQKVDDHDDMIP